MGQVCEANSYSIRSTSVPIAFCGFIFHEMHDVGMVPAVWITPVSTQTHKIFTVPWCGFNRLPVAHDSKK